MSENKRFVTLADTDLEISIKDTITKKYPFNYTSKELTEFGPLLNEVTNICAEMNNLWEQTKRFEKYNQLLIDENEELKAKVDDKEVAVEVETCKVMENVFRVIDEKLEEVENQLNRAVKGGMPTSALYSKINMLDDLKKELQE